MFDAMIFCVPVETLCASESDWHYCSRTKGHPEGHSCPCGESWPADRLLERAILLYIIFYTVPYTVAPHIPTREQALAALSDPRAPFWAQAKAMEEFDGKEIR